jgi:formamidopyrimidine-DNA glycosylase
VPELPEVETIRRGLEPFVVGRRIERAAIRDPRLTRPFDPDEVARQLRGERITGLDRRGKYLVVRFESGRVLLVHLRMTGNFRVAGSDPADGPHDRAVLRLDNGSDVIYRDIRRFGTWLLVEPHELEPYLAERVGDEPLEEAFRTAALASRLAGRRAPIKAALLDQRTVAGLGNIYADEALWRARIHPLRPAGELERHELRRLHRALRDALRMGIARQGATLSNYATPNGERGRMQEEFKVYGREGEPCPRCGTPIEKIRAAGRGTHYCPNCQAFPTPVRSEA